jgi:segregation and condensation protein A
MPAAPYKVRLEVFEGPLDLLLYLIRQEEIDIYDIPVARITRQYLDYLEFMKSLDIELAGEFLVMAATLLKIKSRMLLPRHEELGEEIEDPRKDLVQQLLEYKKFKEIAERLGEKEYQQRRMFPRPRGGFDNAAEIVPPEPPAPEVGMFELLTAFRQVLERIDKLKLYEIVGEDISIEERIDFLLHVITRRRRMTFMELFENEHRRLVMVVTFFALLELMRLGRVSVRQESLFGEIFIECSDQPPPEAGALPTPA